MDATAITSDCTLEHAYSSGRADERDQWTPFATLLQALVLRHTQWDGSVVLPMSAVLELSLALKRARGD